MERFSRTENLIGKERAAKLYGATVAIFGLGGVGGYTVEALARAGVGTLILIDGDTVAESNVNRQIIALSSTVGLDKTAAFAARIKDINPDARVIAHKLFYTAENAETVDISGCDYVVDAIDTVSSKLVIIKKAKDLEIPVISAMGAGNKLNANFKIADIEKTTVCPLARVMRRELRKLGITDVKVCYSDEAANSARAEVNEESGKQIPASISFVPSVMGLLIAGEVIKDIIG